METNQCVCGGEAGGVLANHSKRCDEVFDSSVNTDSLHHFLIMRLYQRESAILRLCHNILKNTCQLNVIVVTMISIEIHNFLMSYLVIRAKYS